MASFSTKTKAIILSTLLICNKYSTIGDKITFFEPVYANGMGTNILLPTKTILDLKTCVSNLDDKELTKGKSIPSNTCAQATINLENIERILKNHINDNQIASLSTEFNKKFASEHVPRTKILDNMLKAIQKLEDTKKTITLEDLKKFYMLTLRFKNKIYRNSEGNSQSNTLVSVHSSNYESESESENENDDFLHTAHLYANVAEINAENTNASTSESGSTDPIYANVAEINAENTNASTSTSDPTAPNSQGPSTTSNPSSSGSETDDVIQKDKTTTSSNYWNNKTQAQTQSSDSNAQSTAKDDTESDINDDNLTPASQHVFNNNIETRYDMNNNNLNQFTAISDSTNQGVLKQQSARGTSRAVSHMLSRNMKLVEKVDNVGEDKNKQPIEAAGSFYSRNVKILKRYELEAKYLYSTTTTPKTNSSSKSNVHGLLINFKRQMTSKLTTGLFYSPIVTNTISINTENKNKNTSGCMDHLFGAYTSYAITPVTHLSNQISFGIAVANNKSSNEKHHNYFVLDSFISHKINIDATKIISPVLGISYYQSNMHPHSKVGETKNLSLDMGVKLQYKYKYNNFDLSPSIKINHVHPLYDNTTGNTKDLSNRGDTPPVDLLRDQQSAFDPYSSVHFALSVRHKSIRFESGYGFTSYHNIEHSYAHTFFAKLNLYL